MTSGYCCSPPATSSCPTPTWCNLTCCSSPRERENPLVTIEKLQGAPDLAIEILSPSTAEKDRGVKRELYGRHGVTEYWLVDPIAETVSIHRQQAGKLAATRTFGREETLRSPLVAGLKLHLDDIFSS